MDDCSKAKKILNKQIKKLTKTLLRIAAEARPNDKSIEAAKFGLKLYPAKFVFEFCERNLVPLKGKVARREPDLFSSMEATLTKGEKIGLSSIGDAWEKIPPSYQKRMWVILDIIVEKTEGYSSSEVHSS